MTTLTASDYALMAGASYISSRDPINRFPVPSGWLGVRYDIQPSGFEAITYINGPSIGTSTDIVISFAGTGKGAADWIHGNIPLAAGFLSDQLRQAADYYLQVKASVPAGTQITFAGHSLGGGLASLLAVFFGESAFTFDQAPFRQSALTFSNTEPETGRVTTRSVAQRLKDYLTGRTSVSLAGLDAYIAAMDPENPNPNAANTLAAREAKITNINVQGEIVFSLPFSRIGVPSNPPNIANSTVGVSASNLHAQSLLAAYLQSEQTAVTGKALNDVTFKLTDLLGMIFDKRLYSFDTDKDARNFLENLVRHEAGVRDPVTGAIVIPADTMVTRFTTDLWKIAQDGGLTLNYKNLADALTAFAMQKYYVETQASTGYNKTLFSDITGGSGGTHFDMQDVATSVTSAKGNTYFNQFLDQYYADLGQAYNVEPIRSALPKMRDWYIQAGTGALIPSLAESGMTC